MLHVNLFAINKNLLLRLLNSLKLYLHFDFTQEKNEKKYPSYQIHNIIDICEI